MHAIVAHTFLNVCEKIHQFLSSNKKLHTERNGFLFFCLTVQSIFVCPAHAKCTDNLRRQEFCRQWTIQYGIRNSSNINLDKDTVANWTTSAIGHASLSQAYLPRRQKNGSLPVELRSSDITDEILSEDTDRKTFLLTVLIISYVELQRHSQLAYVIIIIGLLPSLPTAHLCPLRTSAIGL